MPSFPTASRRTYDQYCPTAKALDVVGQRWTLLIVRELMLGPQRFTDLRDGLPSIGPNVLAERLAQLQVDGLVRRVTLPPPAASNVYELTDLGEELRPAVQELTKFGMNFLGAPAADEHFRLGWLMRSLEVMFRPDLAAGVDDTYEFRLDGEVFHVRVNDGRVRVRQGPAPAPDFLVEASVATFVGMGAGIIDPAQAAASGRARFEGDMDAGMRSGALLGPHLGSLAGPGGMLGAIQQRVQPEQATGVSEAYEFRTEGKSFHIDVHEGEVQVLPGSAPEPAAMVFSAGFDVLVALYLGQTTPQEALMSGGAQLQGDKEAAGRVWRILGMRQDMRHK
jgi:DNA-binding HxlR family transcriptional regulator/putative sterol carrier protein